MVLTGLHFVQQKKNRMCVFTCVFLLLLLLLLLACNQVLLPPVPSPRKKNWISVTAP